MGTSKEGYVVVLSWIVANISCGTHLNLKGRC
jgi:hypothetical protein